MTERVYFIGEITEDWEHGPIKIGIAADPGNRLANLQSSNQRELAMFGWFDAPDGTEKSIHRRLAQHRIRGEWFEPHADVLAVLEEFEQQACPECERRERYIAAGKGMPDGQSHAHTCGLTDRQLSSTEVAT